MGYKWLNGINILAAVLVLAIAVLSWTMLPHDQFMWAVLVIFLIVLLTVYANIRKPLFDYIASRRKAKNLPVDTEIDHRLKMINYMAIIVLIAIAVLSWLFLPREQFTWAVILMMLILVSMGLVNGLKLVRDIS